MSRLCGVTHTNKPTRDCHQVCFLPIWTRLASMRRDVAPPHVVTQTMRPDTRLKAARTRCRRSCEVPEFDIGLYRATSDISTPPCWHPEEVRTHGILLRQQALGATIFPDAVGINRMTQQHLLPIFLAISTLLRRKMGGLAESAGRQGPPRSVAWLEISWTLGLWSDGPKRGSIAMGTFRI